MKNDSLFIAHNFNVLILVEHKVLEAISDPIPKDTLCFFFNLPIVYRRALRNYHHLLCFKLEAQQDKKSNIVRKKNQIHLSLVTTSNKTNEFFFPSFFRLDFYDVF